MPPPVRAVIFDLDDTLFDHSGSVRLALAAWLGDETVADDGRLVEGWFASEKKHYQEWIAGRVSFQEQRRRRLRDVYALLGWPCPPDDEVDALFSAYLAHYERAWRAFDDVHPALTQLRDRGFTLAVLTNGSRIQQHAKVQALGLVEYLEAVVTSDELGAAKPAPSSYLETCERLPADPATTLHVGDRYDVDVAGARSAGLQALHLDRSHKHQETAEHRIASLEELSGRLRRRA